MNRTSWVAALPASWLLANHYPPWVSAWQEGTALAIVGLAALVFSGGASGLPRQWALAGLLAMTTIALQGAVGIVTFSGDAAIAALYLLALGLAILLGHRMATTQRQHGSEGTSAVDALAIGLVLGSLWSAGLAVAQWLGATHLGIWMADLVPTSRPYANFAQPNHLCSALFLGLVACGWLRQNAKIGNALFWVIACILLNGMVMTGSRTAWLQLAALAVLVLLLRRQTSMRLTPLEVASLVAVYVLCSFVWGQAHRDPLLAQPRTLDDQLQAGVRLPLWGAMLHALSERPWTGYGWQQVATAQFEVALSSTPLQRHFEHAHNIILDLLLWCGIPVGLAILVLLGHWLFARARHCTDPLAAWFLVLAVGLICHGLVEFPLEYAYFLMPLGLAVGLIEGVHPRGGTLPLRPVTIRAGGALLVAVLAVVVWDYVRAEEGYRSLRMQTAGIGRSSPEPVPQLLVLNQLEAFQRFARTEASVGISPAEVDRMTEVVRRFPYPPAMFRLALAQGLVGQADKAAETLRRLCSMHPDPRCREAKEAWGALTARHTVLSRVAWP